MSYSPFNLYTLGLLLIGIVYIANGFSTRFEIDTSEAPDLEEFGKRVERDCSKWYPHLAKYFYSSGYEDPEKITIKFNPRHTGVAGADAFGAYIEGSVNYFREHKDDVGAFIHEMTHVINRYTNCDGSIVEGMADMVRWYWYEPDERRPPKDRNENFENVTPFFLNFVDKKVKRGRRAIKAVNKSCRDGNYDEKIWKEVTGMDLRELWKKMQREA